jgi:hypothetical protein
VLRKLRILLLAAVVIFLLAIVSLVVFMRSGPPVGPPLPNPNGYDDFLKAAALVTGDVRNAWTLDHDGLRALVSTNAEPLRLIRLGLSRECLIPTDSAMTNLSVVKAELASLMNLARLLAEEGRLGEMEARNEDAAQSYVDAIRFGNEIDRAGLIIYSLVGVACESFGQTPLSRLVPKLNSREARPLIAELEKIDSAGITGHDLPQDEYRTARSQLGTGFNPITLVTGLWQNWRSFKSAEVRYKNAVAHVRLLTLELALRCFQSQQGIMPTALAQLVPKYLQRVPLDPFSGHSLVYRPQGTNWVLYSVGDDGVDNGGKRVGRSASGTVTKGDLFYDSPY